MGETLVSMVTENKEIVENMWESISDEMHKKIEDEIEKAKKQMLDFQNKKEEQ